MSKPRILVVEDEIIIADNICDTLSILGYETLDPVISYSEAVQSIEKHHPDLVMLDIQLSGTKDGIDLAWKIREDYDIPFIFLTSNADKLTVERAKKVVPPAYLVKPFNKDDLYTSIEIAIFNYAQKNLQTNDSVIIKNALFVKQQKALIKIEFDKIIFIHSEHVYLEVITDDGRKLVIRSSLNEFIKKLNQDFFRVHRSYIINLKHLQSIEQGGLLLKGHEIPIGKNYRNELLNKIQLG
jgi:DNA-binding LytR/AlgR family response regulator